mmetsp:Transcript_34895/g.49514  ORF Transcript_34895/g.49514 Transcript_34895/m.49514 type:complete len:154 (+) Transcript_34895:108-569(+)
MNSLMRRRSLFLPFFLFFFCLVDRIATAPNSCVSKNEDEYFCTNDALYARQLMDATKGINSINSQGVQQSVDGTYSEREAVSQVLLKMEEYFVNEVLSKSDYENVRERCRNNNRLCAFWASVGECESNRIFMLDNCAAACRLCLLAMTKYVQV